jgi:dihydrofolate reductase
VNEPIACVVAMARRGAIGRGNALPWRLPEDLRRFKALTLGHGVVMGRRTWDSIGRPLPGRTNIVISRDPGWRASGAVRVEDLDAACTCARDAHPGLPVMVIGGAQIYALALPRARLLHVTEIEIEVPDADAFFPPIDPALWRRVREEPHVADGGMRYRFVAFERIA